MMCCAVRWDERDCWKLASARGPRPCKGYWMDMKKCWWVRACSRRCEKKQPLLFFLTPGLDEGEDQGAEQYNQLEFLHCAKRFFFLHLRNSLLVAYLCLVGSLSAKSLF